MRASDTVKYVSGWEPLTTRNLPTNLALLSAKPQEIGIRMALSATDTRVQLDVIRDTPPLAVLGTLAGNLASFAVARAISSMLFGTQPTDVITFCAVILVLSVIALLAGYIPARRASRIQPMIALRSN